MHVSKVFINILLLYCASSWRLSSSDMSKRAESYLDGSFEPRMNVRVRSGVRCSCLRSSAHADARSWRGLRRVRLFLSCNI